MSTRLCFVIPPSAGVDLGYLSGLVGVILERWGTGPTPCFPCPDKENPGFDPPRPPIYHILIYIGGQKPRNRGFRPPETPKFGVSGGPRGPPGAPSRDPEIGVPGGPPPGTPKSGVPGRGPPNPQIRPPGAKFGDFPRNRPNPPNSGKPRFGGFCLLIKD